MPRPPQADEANGIYHVLNRGNQPSENVAVQKLKLRIEMKKRPNPFSEWLGTVQMSVPVSQADAGDYGREIEELLRRHPFAVGSILEALLWLRVGAIDRSHEIVQDAQNGLPAYVHGVIHRMEGDYWNANYWFQRVRDDALLAQLKQKINSGCADQAFSPVRFTDAVERSLSSGESSKNKASDPVQLEKTATQEWETLWEWAIEREP